MFKIQKGYDSESKTFRLPVELIEQLEKLAAQNKLSLNQLVIQCLNYAVSNLDTDGQEEGKEKDIK
ncbi:MAG TPA: toxin-antitoxin system HicB family antitoxin [Firmicutes bacterium]|nr:toxin-antitoxin system HicB family antitoxin [Bacillota bacterium]